jgi:hypothetical protein
VAEVSDKRSLAWLLSLHRAISSGTILPNRGIIAPESRLAKPGKPLDIGTWLCGLGLEQYEVAFRENDIDAEVLPELTADD